MPIMGKIFSITGEDLRKPEEPKTDFQILGPSFVVIQGHPSLTFQKQKDSKALRADIFVFTPYLQIPIVSWQKQPVLE